MCEIWILDRSSSDHKFTQGHVSKHHTFLRVQPRTLPPDATVWTGNLTVHKEDLPDQGRLHSWWSGRTASCKRPRPPPSGSSCTRTRWCPGCACGEPQRWTPCSLDRTQGSAWCWGKKKIRWLSVKHLHDNIKNIQAELPLFVKALMNTALKGVYN